MRTASPIFGLAAEALWRTMTRRARLGVADDMRLGAEQLHDDHGGTDDPALAQVQRLGPQAEDDLGPYAADGIGHRRGQRHRRPREGDAEGAAPAGAGGAAGAPLSTSIPSMRFMPGLPRKRATNALAGCA